MERQPDLISSGTSLSFGKTELGNLACSNNSWQMQASLFSPAVTAGWVVRQSIYWVKKGIGFQAVLLSKCYIKICWLECVFFHTVKKGINSTLSLSIFPNCLSYSQFSIAQLWYQIAKQVSDRVYPVKRKNVYHSQLFWFSWLTNIITSFDVYINQWLRICNTIWCC